MKQLHAIRNTDWERVTELAAEVGENSRQSENARLELVGLLDELINEYGRMPKLLATYADYVEDPQLAIPLLEEALKLEEGPERMYTMDSLAGRYVELLNERPPVAVTRQRLLNLLDDFKNLLDQFPDEFFRDELNEFMRVAIAGKEGVTE